MVAEDMRQQDIEEADEKEAEYSALVQENQLVEQMAKERKDSERMSEVDRLKREE